MSPQNGMPKKIQGTNLGRLYQCVTDCVNSYYEVKNEGIKLAGIHVRKNMIEAKKLVELIRIEMQVTKIGV